MTYNKRQKAHWNTGKGCKGNRKAKEKVFSDDEVDEQLASEDPNYRYNYSQRKRNTKAQLEHRIQWYKEILARYDREKTNTSFSSYLRDSLKKCKKKLTSLVASGKVKKT